MTSHPNGHEPPSTLAAQLQTAGVRIADCYQCGKCSAGCPLGGRMDLPPSRLLRLLQLGLPGMDARALGSEALWLCLTCETCTSRCPQKVEITRAMDQLRHTALERGLAHPAAQDILAFHRSLLDTVRHTGRLYEIGLVAAYKLRTRRLLQDVALVPGLLRRGKLALLPHRIRDRKGLRAVFHRAASKG